MDVNYFTDQPSVGLILGAVALFAGILRGFSGFGSSLLVVPALGFFVGPTVAVAIATLLECLATLLLFVPALKYTNTRVLIPMAGAANMAIPVGHAALTHTNPALSNLLISLAVVCMAIWLMAGGALRFPRGIAGRVGAGSLSGLLTGFGGVGGPPLVIYILSGTESAAIKRANVITISGVALIAAVASMYYFGLLDHQAMLGGLLLAPLFLLGGVIGARLFKAAPERIYQRVALSALLLVSCMIFVVNLIRIAG